MLPFTDPELIRRHEATVEIETDHAADPDTVRADLLERAVVSVGATIGPASLDRIIVATVDVTLSIRSGALQEAIETVLPISIRFDVADDHGDGTTGWAPEALLRAVIRNELERVWRLYGAADFLGRALAIQDRRASLAA
jgi:hypothetical protein